MTGEEQDAILKDAVDWVRAAVPMGESEQVALMGWAAQAWAVLDALQEVQGVPEQVAVRLAEVNGRAPRVVVQVGGRLAEAGAL